jgi:hypothetical protein
MRTIEAKGDGVVQLMRQTVEDLADLVGQHVKLARLELTMDLAAAARRARLTVALALLAAVGYALTMAGLAVCLGGNLRVGVALSIVGLVHVAGGGVGAFLSQQRGRHARVMDATGDEMSRSLSAIAITSGAAPGASPGAPSGAPVLARARPDPGART